MIVYNVRESIIDLENGRSNMALRSIKLEITYNNKRASMLKGIRPELLKEKKSWYEVILPMHDRLREIEEADKTTDPLMSFLKQTRETQAEFFLLCINAQFTQEYLDKVTEYYSLNDASQLATDKFSEYEGVIVGSNPGLGFFAEGLVKLQKLKSQIEGLQTDLELQAKNRKYFAVTLEAHKKAKTNLDAAIAKHPASHLAITEYFAALSRDEQTLIDALTPVSDKTYFPELGLTLEYFKSEVNDRIEKVSLNLEAFEGIKAYKAKLENQAAKLREAAAQRTPVAAAIMRPITAPAPIPASLPPAPQQKPAQTVMGVLPAKPAQASPVVSITGPVRPIAAVAQLQNLFEDEDGVNDSFDCLIVTIDMFGASCKTSPKSIRSIMNSFYPFAEKAANFISLSTKMSAEQMSLNTEILSQSD